jgi:hypothetical protein
MRRISLHRPTPAMVVALLALFVALGGTGYAVATLPANSIGAKQLKKSAVTGKKIKKNAITSPKVKDFSLLAKDFKPGQLPAGAAGPKGDKGEPGSNGANGVQGPPGPTFAETAMGSSFEAAADPSASPDESSSSAVSHGRHFDFTLPASGKVYLRFFTPVWGMACTAGTAQFGLYLDGAPVAKSAHTLPPTASGQARESVVVISASAGAHQAESRADCPGGTISGSNENNVPSWTVLLLAS